MSEISPPFNAYSESEPYVFVSYAHKDKAQVYPLLQKMHQDRVRIWYDEGIQPSDKWKKVIAEKLYQCSAFIVFLTASAVISENVLDEIYIAEKRYKNKEIQFISIYLEKFELPRELELSIGRIQALMYSEDIAAEIYRKLYQILIQLRIQPPTIQIILVNGKDRTTTDVNPKETLNGFFQILKRSPKDYSLTIGGKEIDIFRSLTDPLEKIVNTYGNLFTFQERPKTINMRFKTSVIGDVTGKTSLIMKFINDTFYTDLRPTLGLSISSETFELKQTTRDYHITLMIWDLNGNKFFGKVRGHYYQNTDGFILMANAGDPNTLQFLTDRIIPEIKQAIEKHVPTILVLNKIDLYDEKNRIPLESVNNFMQTHGIKHVFWTSAKTGENIRDAFHGILQSMMEEEINALFLSKFQKRIK